MSDQREEVRRRHPLKWSAVDALVRGVSIAIEGGLARPDRQRRIAVVHLLLRSRMVHLHPEAIELAHAALRAWLPDSWRLEIKPTMTTPEREAKPRRKP